MSDIRFALLTGAILILSYFTAISVASLETVLAFVGSTGSTAISFILPGLFYWKLCSPEGYAYVNKDDDDMEPEDVGVDENSADDETAPLFNVVVRRKQWLRWGALALAIYGFCVMALCLTMNIVQLALR